MIDWSKLETIEQRVAKEASARALAYLRETDWYAYRLAETGKPIPEHVLAKRAASRELVIEE